LNQAGTLSLIDLIVFVGDGRVDQTHVRTPLYGSEKAIRGAASNKRTECLQEPTSGRIWLWEDGGEGTNKSISANLGQLED
jgi:hypothetical protein